MGGKLSHGGSVAGDTGDCCTWKAFASGMELIGSAGGLVSAVESVGVLPCDNGCVPVPPNGTEEAVVPDELVGDSQVGVTANCPVENVVDDVVCCPVCWAVDDVVCDIVCDTAGDPE